MTVQIGMDLRSTRTHENACLHAGPGMGIFRATFREHLAQRPFKPLRLVMSSGQTYEIRHSEMAWLTRTSILVGIDDSEDGVPAEFKIYSLLNITAVEPLPIGSRQSADASP